MNHMNKATALLCLFALIWSSYSASFSSYVPEYYMGLPNGPAQYGSYPFINQFDPYLSVIRSESLIGPDPTSPRSIPPP